MDTWRKVGPTSNLCLKRQKNGKKALFFFEENRSEGSEIEGENLHLLSMIYGDRVVGIVEPRFKVHLLNEGYVWVPTTCSFTKDFGFGVEKLVREALPSL